MEENIKSPTNDDFSKLEESSIKKKNTMNMLKIQFLVQHLILNKNRQPQC